VADALATAWAEAHDLREQLRSATARLTQLRDGIRGEISGLARDGGIGLDRANDTLRRLRVTALRRTFHCQIDLPVAIDVDTVGDASALEQARRILTDGIAALAEIIIRREPDCFGIDAPRGTGDGRACRLVHTTVPLTITVTAAEQRSAWPAAKRRLGTQLRRLPAIRVEIGAVGELVIRDARHNEVDRICLR